ncbi:hypothetical protein CB343_003124 [Salmonella enterica subsp. diarizonae]|nr:hypothetical protein [Salmonella enterica subsp. diarizonae]
MVLESQGEYDSQWAAICSIAPKIGCQRKAEMPPFSAKQQCPLLGCLSCFFALEATLPWVVFCWFYIKL